MNPTVSVIIPSYNHEKFIEEAINSVLNQTYSDFELIIVDDCSPDQTLSVIKKIKDSRIRLFINESNQGAVYTTNFAIKQAKGRYLALLNSDDMWSHDKLKMQVEFLECNPDIGAVFTDAKFMNEKYEILTKADYFWSDVFDKENRSSAQWLRYFFFNFNCLCHPSILIRREIYQKTELYDPSLRQLPDFKMWVHLLKFINIHVLNEQLVTFRVLDNGENASSDTSGNRIRTRNEIFLIMNVFFDNFPLDLFKEGFGDLMRNKDIQTEEQYLCEQAFMYLNMHSEVSYIYKLMAIEKFHKLLSDEHTRMLLENEYSFTYRDYFTMTGEYELLDSSQTRISNIVKETARKHLEGKSSSYNFFRNLYRKVMKKDGHNDK